MPEQPIEAALWRLLNIGGLPEDAAVARAVEIWATQVEREVLQAFIIARASDAVIYSSIRLQGPVLNAYRYLFLNVHVFRDDLDILTWMDTMERNDSGTAFERGLLRMAYNEGAEKIAWVYGRGDAVIDPQRVISQAMVDLYFRGRAHRGISLSSKEMKTACSMLEASVKIATVIGNQGAPDLKQIILKLKHRDSTERVDDVVQREEILH